MPRSRCGANGDGCQLVDTGVVDEESSPRSVTAAAGGYPATMPSSMPPASGRAVGARAVGDGPGPRLADSDTSSTKRSPGPGRRQRDLTVAAHLGKPWCATAYPVGRVAPPGAADGSAAAATPPVVSAGLPSTHQPTVRNPLWPPPRSPVSTPPTQRLGRRRAPGRLRHPHHAVPGSSQRQLRPAHRRRPGRHRRRSPGW